jgi:hypothetical protein
LHSGVYCSKKWRKFSSGLPEMSDGNKKIQITHADDEYRAYYKDWRENNSHLPQNDDKSTKSKLQ